MINVLSNQFACLIWPHRVTKIIIRSKLWETLQGLCQSASQPISFFSSHKVFSRGKLVAHGRKLYMVDYKKHMTTSTNYKMKSMFISQGFLEFNVTHEMVPSSRILLFYVREDRETVAATMQFNTEATLENEVCALN